MWRVILIRHIYFKVYPVLQELLLRIDCFSFQFAYRDIKKACPE